MRKSTMPILISILSLWLASSIEAASVQPKRGGTLTFGISKELALMNPLVNTSSTESRIRELMYEPLLARDSSGAIQPRLAESWEVSKDGKLYTFRLRKNVKFHSGKEMTADDIKFALDYTLNPKNGAYGFEDLNAVDRSEVVDKYTLRIHMKRHNPLFPTLLTEIRSFSAVPNESLPEGLRKPTTFPPGTGPFKFVEWQPGQRIVFERHEDYWGHKAYVDRVIMREIGDNTVRFTALQSGDVDLIERTPYEWVQQITQGKIKGIGIAKAARAGARNLEFNVPDPPFNNKKLRQAIAYAIDRKEIMQAAYFGLADTAEQRFPSGHVWYFKDVSAPRFDPDKAKALLKEAGYKGETLELRRQGKYMFKLAGGSDFPDPLPAYEEYACEPDPQKRRLNESGYCDKEYDALLKKAEGEVDLEKRKAIFKQVVAKLTDDLPILVIGFTPRFFTFRSHVKNFATNASGDFEPWGAGLSHAWIDK